MNGSITHHMHLTPKQDRTLDALHKTIAPVFGITLHKKIGVMVLRFTVDGELCQVTFSITAVDCGVHRFCESCGKESNDLRFVEVERRWNGLKSRHIEWMCYDCFCPQ